MLTMTEQAIIRAKEIIAQNKMQGSGLRIGVMGGGCSGLSYKMDFEKEPSTKDKILEFDGLKVFVDPKAYLYLQNVEVGFHQDMMSANFTFKNPDAKATCGCGTSFAV